MLFTRCVSLAFLIALCPFTLAQYTAGKVIFKNPGGYQQADLEAVAQLHAHDKVSHDVLQAAAQRLIDTGYFDDVGASLEGPSSAINVTFTLKPYQPEQMTAVSFENFVWLTPAERDAALHTTAPLFAGRLPEAGNQTDAVTAALQAALTAKGVKCTIVHADREASLVHPLHAIIFRAEKPSVRNHAIKLSGVSHELAPSMQKAASSLRNGAYTEGVSKPTTQDELLSPYFDAGYIDAKLDDFHRDIAETTPSAVGVDITATVNPGEVYHVGAISFAGTPIISTDDVIKAAKLHAGDIASHSLLVQTLSPIDAAYRRLGYMDVFVDPGAKADSATHAVSYNVTVSPGEQYRLRSVTPNGLSAAAQADWDKAWKMGVGELYSPEYVGKFVVTHPELKSLQPYTCGWQALSYPQDHLVDLSIDCFSSRTTVEAR